MKTWATIATEHLSSLDYSKLALTNAETTPKNLAGDTALIKWYGDMPAEVVAISHTILTNEQASMLLKSIDWAPEELN